MVKTVCCRIYTGPQIALQILHTVAKYMFSKHSAQQLNSLRTILQMVLDACKTKLSGELCLDSKALIYLTLLLSASKPKNKLGAKLMIFYTRC